MSKPFEFPAKYDGLSKYGAGLLCDAIHAHWIARGFGNVVAERFLMPGTGASWGVRSNLVQGLPPAKRVRPRMAQ